MRFIIMLSILMIAANQLVAQVPQGAIKKSAKPVTSTTATETMKVLGNCGMCKKNHRKICLKCRRDIR